MATAPQLHAEDITGADDFAALEQRVMRMVDLLRQERRARASAEENAATLQQLLDEQGAQLTRVEEERATLERERGEVRGRVERLLGQLNDLD